MRFTNPLSITVAVSAALVAPAIFAQTSEPFVGVVTKDDVPLRSGAAMLFYQVGTLKSGVTLKIDREESGFYRVEYPAGMKAFVNADDVTVDSAGKVAKLNKPSRLKAANANGGPRGSWYNLLEKEADTGTELKVIEAVKGDDGKIMMYSVTPPVAARAFLNKEWVRRATAEEAAATPPATTAGGSLVAAPGDAAKPADATKPAGTPTTTDPAKPTDTTKAAEGAGVKPSAAANDGVAPATGVKPSTPPPAAAAATQVEKLTAVFNAVRSQPEAEAEASQALLEIERHISTVDSSPAGVREKKYLGRFVEYLKLRADIQDARRKTEASTKNVDLATQALRDEIKKLEAQAVYTAIGRLTTSAVYDGTRLPKLYRLVSPEPGVPRTIGYLMPDASMDLDGKIGRIVGVVGDSKNDESLRATILTARRVDVVSLQPVYTSKPANPPANPAGTPGSGPVDINK